MFSNSEKDIDCDIRENIINYEDEGGGEGDQVGGFLFGYCDSLRFGFLLYSCIFRLDTICRCYG